LILLDQLVNGLLATVTNKESRGYEMGSLEVFGEVIGYKPILVAIAVAFAIVIISFLGALSGRSGFISDYRSGSGKRKMRIK